MNKTEALYSFYSSFGLPAYEENSVPREAKMPYITYEVATDKLGDYTTSLTCDLWYKSNSWVQCNALTERLSEKLSGGHRMKVDKGYMILYSGTPFATSVNEPDDNTIKHKSINIECDYITIS